MTPFGGYKRSGLDVKMASRRSWPICNKICLIATETSAANPFIMKWGNIQMGLTSTHWGTYQPGTGRIQMSGRRSRSSISAGGLSMFWMPVADNRPYGAQRLAGAKGSCPVCPAPGNSYVEVDWQTALDLVAGELNRVRTDYGNQAIYAGCYGWASAGRFHHAQRQIHRFLNCIGGYTKSVNTYSFAAAEVIVPHAGDFRGFIYNQTSWNPLSRMAACLSVLAASRLKMDRLIRGNRQTYSKTAYAGSPSGWDTICQYSPLQTIFWMW